MPITHKPAKSFKTRIVMELKRLEFSRIDVRGCQIAGPHEEEPISKLIELLASILPHPHLSYQQLSSLATLRVIAKLVRKTLFL